jgi:hypothetical protein
VAAAGDAHLGAEEGCVLRPESAERESIDLTSLFSTGCQWVDTRDSCVGVHTPFDISDESLFPFCIIGQFHNRREKSFFLAKSGYLFLIIFFAPKIFLKVATSSAT